MIPGSAGDPHIYAAGQDRENLATDRWLDSIGRLCFSAVFGLPGAWWCGIRLSRACVLDGSLAGDIDIVAGPLDYVEGRVQWPPRNDYLVACEVKASWFEAGVGWHRTHEQEIAEIKGQLTILLDAAFDRVAFFHVGATKPSQEPGNPWLVALDDAYQGRRDFPELFAPGELPACVAHFSAVIGSVSHKTEEAAGAGGAPTVHQACAPNPSASVQAWRHQLRDRLAGLPTPPVSNVFIKACRTCQQWTMLYRATGTVCLRCHPTTEP